MDNHPRCWQHHHHPHPGHKHHQWNRHRGLPAQRLKCPDNYRAGRRNHPHRYQSPNIRHPLHRFLLLKPSRRDPLDRCRDGRRQYRYHHRNLRLHRDIHHCHDRLLLCLSNRLHPVHTRQDRPLFHRYHRHRRKHHQTYRIQNSPGLHWRLLGNCRYHREHRLHRDRFHSAKRHHPRHQRR